jgi:formamidopyrimidine-DNA glycosylase
MTVEGAAEDGERKTEDGGFEVQPTPRELAWARVGRQASGCVSRISQTLHPLPFRPSMPELPEVETMRRGIVGVTGSRIVGVERWPCRLRPIRVRPAIPSFRRRAVGHRIVDVGRVGKRIVLKLETQDAVVFEPRMTGLVLLSDPPDTEHLRFRLTLDGQTITQLWFWDRRGLGSVQLLSPSQFARQLGDDKVGPDALSLTADALRARLGRNRRAIKVAMLDQRALAGIGNLYASEILHAARIHPATPCCQLTDDDWSRLCAAVQATLREAIRCEGSTLSDGTYRTALNDPGNYQSHHRVYDREGEPCSTCGRAMVQRIIQSQRSTFFCRRCQPPRSEVVSGCP